MPDHSRVLHVERHHDSTQVVVRFGARQEQLQPIARYIVPVEPLEAGRPPRFKNVSWKEYNKRFPKAAPTKGYVEFFAQTLECSTDYKTEISSAPFYEDTRAPLLPPSILTKANASTIYEAVDVRMAYYLYYDTGPTPYYCNDDTHAHNNTPQNTKPNTNTSLTRRRNEKQKEE